MTSSDDSHAGRTTCRTNIFAMRTEIMVKVRINDDDKNIIEDNTGRNIVWQRFKMTTPLVEMDGDEMTRILWKMIKDELIASVYRSEDRIL